jgi:hypothetical protein
VPRRNLEQREAAEPCSAAQAAQGKETVVQTVQCDVLHCALASDLLFD